MDRPGFACKNPRSCKTDPEDASGRSRISGRLDPVGAAHRSCRKDRLGSAGINYFAGRPGHSGKVRRNWAFCKMGLPDAACTNQSAGKRGPVDAEYRKNMPDP